MALLLKTLPENNMIGEREKKKALRNKAGNGSIEEMCDDHHPAVGFVLSSRSLSFEMVKDLPEPSVASVE